MGININSGNYLDDTPNNPFRKKQLIYQKRPELWFVERWGGDLENLKWSTRREYDDHDWDGTPDPLFTAWRAIAACKWPAVESCTGAGKCLGEGTPVMMFDGSIKLVEDIVEGDVLMGHDNTPRTVLNTNSGYEEMFHIQGSHSLWGDFVCNKSHILTLCKKSTPERRADPEYHIDNLYDISVADYLTMDIDERKDLRLVRKKGYTYPSRKDEPNLTYAWLRGFNMFGRNYKDNFSFEQYEDSMYASEQYRKVFLAGILDYFNDGINHADTSILFRIKLVQKEIYIKCDILSHILTSLGIKFNIKDEANFNRFEYEINKDDLNKIEPKLFDLDYKTNSTYTKSIYDKSPFTITSQGVGQYFGFTLKEDPHFVLGDGTITHNTYMLKLIIYWYLDCFPNALIVTLATKFEQLKRTLWKEVKEDWPKFQQLRPMAEYYAQPRIEIKLPVYDDNGKPKAGEWDIREAYATTAQANKGEEVAQGAAGLHGVNMLIILDEASGIQKPVLNAVINTCTDPHNVIAAFGNPKNQLDALHVFRKKKTTIGITVSALDHPNVVCQEIVIPGAVSQSRIDSALTEYGEDHPLYQALIRGKSPESSADSIIKAKKVREITNIEPEIIPEYEYVQNPNEIFVGVDVARSQQGDKAVVTMIKDNRLFYLKEFACPDASAIAYNMILDNAALHEYLEFFTDGVERFYDLPNLLDLDVLPENVFVDIIGVGTSTVEAFHSPALNFPVIGVSGSKKPIEQLIPENEKNNPLFGFTRLKAQQVWLMERDVRKKWIAVEENETITPEISKELRLELATYKQSTSDRAKFYDLQPKSSMSSSPNKADSFLLANFARHVFYAGVPSSAFDMGGRNFFGVNF